MTTSTSDTAGPQLRLLHTTRQMQEAAELWRRVWGGQDLPVPPAVLLAQAHVGGYVAGAWLDDEMVGASMGLLGPPGTTVLHSHITGVLPAAAGRGVGLALKRHQADWCRRHGIDTVTWTFDPLVARNAWFNLSRLGVRVDAYLVDFYGDMPDDRNRGQGSDRLLAAWDLGPRHADDAGPPASARPHPRPRTPDGDVPDDPGEVVEALVAEALVVDDHEAPRRATVPGDATTVSVALPTDIETLRRRDPDLAIRWRHAVREVLGARLDPRSDPSWRVAGFTRDGCYLLTRPPP